MLRFDRLEAGAAKMSDKDESDVAALALAAEEGKIRRRTRQARRVIVSSSAAGMASVSKAGGQVVSAGLVVGRHVASGAKSAGTAIATAASAVSRSVGDLNGDGKVDEEDLRIAQNALKRTATVVGAEAAGFGKSVLRHEMTKDAATGAIIGAAIAAPLPLVGPAVGAAAGAAIAVTRGVLGRPAKDTLAGEMIAAGGRAVGEIVVKAVDASRPAAKLPSK